jgi:ABC-type antimicrobial peptide transport system permease subunit
MLYRTCRADDTLGGLVERALSARRFTATLFGLFATVALAIAVAGLCGVLSYSVSRRSRELGVHMALGADPTRLTASVLRRGATLLGIGRGLGCAMAWAAGRVTRGLVVDVGPADSTSFLSAATTLVVVGITACLVPAVRAARADPRIDPARVRAEAEESRAIRPSPRSVGWTYSSRMIRTGSTPEARRAGSQAAI